MTSAARPDPLIRLSYSIGVPLAVSLALLRASHAVLPAWFRGQTDYALGVHDPALWATFHAYLLIGGTGPALGGVILGVVGLGRRPGDVWAWIGTVTCAGFLIVAIQLLAVLLRQGFFGFVFSALPRFLDV